MRASIARAVACVAASLAVSSAETGRSIHTDDAVWSAFDAYRGPGIADADAGVRGQSYLAREPHFLAARSFSWSPLRLHHSTLDHWVPLYAEGATVHPPLTQAVAALAPLVSAATLEEAMTDFLVAKLADKARKEPEDRRWQAVLAVARALQAAATNGLMSASAMGASATAAEALAVVLPLLAPPATAPAAPASYGGGGARRRTGGGDGCRGGG